MTSGLIRGDDIGSGITQVTLTILDAAGACFASESARSHGREKVTILPKANIPPRSSEAPS